MTKICTNLEQSKRLQSLGISVNTADMYYPNRVGMDNYPLPIEWKKGLPLLPLLSQEIPAWSLSALLGLMPKEEDDELDLCYGAYKGDGEYAATWACSCNNYFDFGDTSVDAVFNVLCWLKENGKI